MTQLKKKKIIIVLASDKYKPQAFMAYRENCLAGNESFILVDYAVSLDAQYPIKTLHYYRTVANMRFMNIWSDFHILFSNWSKCKLSERADLKELTSYKGVSLWSICSQELLVALIPLIEKINTIQAVIERELPDELILFGGKTVIEQVCISFCRLKGISARMSGFDVLPASANVKFLLRFILEPLREIKRFVVSLRDLIFNLSHKDNIAVNPDVLFFVSEERFSDTLFPVIELFNPQQKLVVNSATPGSRKKLISERIEFKEFDGYLLNYPFNLKKTFFLNKIWSTILKNKEFQESLTYKGLPLWGHIKDMLYYLVFSVFKDKIRRMDIAENIFSIYRPKIAVVPNNLQEVISVAKESNIPVMAIQCSSPEEFIVYGKVLADKVTVDGRHWKELLVKNGMLQDKIMVTGPPKFDHVLRRLNTYSHEVRNRFLRKMNIDTDKKLVIWAGTHTDAAFGLFDQQYREIIFELYSSLKGLENIQLLVKLHPFEFDFNFYRQIAKDAGFDDLIVVKDVDKWELLFAGDLLITFFSMISYDATIVDRPVIYMQDFDRYLPGVLFGDVWDFKGSRAVVCLEDFSGLRNTIEKVLYDCSFREELKENRRRYIESHLSFLGEGSLRVKKEIERFYTCAG